MIECLESENHSQGRNDMYITLNSLKAETNFIIKQYKLDKSLIKRFMLLGLHPKQKLKVLNKHLSGLVIGTEFFKVAIDYKIANQILVSSNIN
jgi:Fe2+ transport system protein FeoA